MGQKDILNQSYAIKKCGYQNVLKQKSLPHAASVRFSNAETGMQLGGTDGPLPSCSGTSPSVQNGMPLLAGRVR